MTKVPNAVKTIVFHNFIIITPVFMDEFGMKRQVEINQQGLTDYLFVCLFVIPVNKRRVNTTMATGRIFNESFLRKVKSVMGQNTIPSQKK